MMFAQVVPIRRMPAQRPWLTYSVPEGMEIGVGSLVSIPLRNAPVMGVVWEITKQEPAGVKTQPIRSVLIADQIVTPWQKNVCELLADNGSTSLGDVLFRVVPRLSVGRLTKSIKLNSAAAPSNGVKQESSFLWYRRRTEAHDQLTNIIKIFPKRPIAIVTPTVDDAQEILRVAERLGRVAVHLHSKLSPTEYAAWYSRILNNEPIIVIGSVFVLALPFYQTPILFLDQEEHHAHKQTAQFPYYDTRVVFNNINQPYHVNTPAPSLHYYQRHKPAASLPAGYRKLISLHGPSGAPMMSEELLTLIDAAHDQHRAIVCISPRRGFSSYTSCRSCGTPLTCPKCGRVASLFHGVADEARCHSCQTTVALSFACRRCGSSAWTFHGLGIEQTVSVLQRLRPQLNIAPVIRTDVAADIAVDTYQAYRLIRHLPNVAAVVVISGDSLLSAPDFSVAERAWQYMARLQAETSGAQIVVQTWQPENVFWQRWLHSDDRAWYDDELAQRQRLKVPPFSRQWIASYRGAKNEVDKKIQELNTVYGKFFEVQLLPTQRRHPLAHRILMTFFPDAKEVDLPWANVFPLPWHLDRYPNSWLD